MVKLYYFYFFIILFSILISLLELYQPTWAAKTKYYRLSGLNCRHLFLTVLEVKKSKIKVPADLVLGEGPLPGLAMAAFLLCHHMEERGRERKRERANSGLSSSSYKGTKLIMGVHSHDLIQTKLPPKGHTSKYYHIVGQGFNIRILRDTVSP